MREIRALDAAFDPAPGRRLGLVSLASDCVASEEIRAVAGGPGREIFETRIANADAISPESLRAMETGLTEAAARLPGGRYDAAAYLCTSASRLIGFARVAELVRAALPGAAVTNPMQAGIAAAGALGVRRIAIVTPYVAEVTEAIAGGFEEAGIAVASLASFFVASDALVARIDAASLARAAAEGATGADAVFLSCTALRTVHGLARLEAAVGRPVLSSNQAVAWDMLRHARLAPAPGPWGRLFEHAPPAATAAA